MSNILFFITAPILLPVVIILGIALAISIVHRIFFSGKF